jgi:hypothetical protein
MLFTALRALALRLTTRASADIRALGLPGDAVALWSRAQRRAADWAPHEARCHAIVGRAVADLPQRRTVLVLGSGLCRDVPVEPLAQEFATVILVDAVHLWPVRRRFAKHPNVRFVTADITGAGAWIAGHADAPADVLAPWHADDTVDLVISANVLSQLAIGPEDYLDAHPERAAALPPNLPDALIAAHLEDLAAFRCRVCLLTDVEMRKERRDGTVIERMDLLGGQALPKPDAAWDWTVAPYGEMARDIARIHIVHGYADLTAAQRRTSHSGQNETGAEENSGPGLSQSEGP